jgi:hypothetical protein
MTNEFKKISSTDETRYVLESSDGATTVAGNIASTDGDNLIAQEGDKVKSPVAKAAQKVAKGAGRHKNPKDAVTQPRKEKHKKPVSESTARDDWTAASDARKAEHDKREAEMNANHAQGKENMKGAIDRLEKHVNTNEEFEIGEPGPGEKIQRGYRRQEDKDFLSWRVDLSTKKIPRDVDHINDLKNYLANLEIYASYSVASDYSDSPYYGRQKSKENALKKIPGIKADIARLEAEGGGVDRTKEPEPSGIKKKNEFDITDPKQGIEEKWSQKYKSSINCSHPKGFSQKAHCAGKKKHNEDVTMEHVCPDCGMCEAHGNLNEIKKGQKDSNGYTKCWTGYHADGTQKGKNGPVRKCVKNENVAEGPEYNEYSDEVDMVENNLLTIIRACKELADTLKAGENLPEWVEEKISMSKQNMVTVSEYLQSQHDQGHIYDEDHSTATGGWGQGSMNAAYKSSALAGAGHDDRAMEGYFGRLQEKLDTEVDERSVSQAQARIMAAAAHNPVFAKKVGIKTNVAKDFNKADTGRDISKLPKRVIPKKKK